MTKHESSFLQSIWFVCFDIWLQFMDPFFTMLKNSIFVKWWLWWNGFHIHSFELYLFRDKERDRQAEREREIASRKSHDQPCKLKIGKFYLAYWLSKLNSFVNWISNGKLMHVRQYVDRHCLTANLTKQLAAKWNIYKWARKCARVAKRETTSKSGTRKKIISF